MSNQKRDETAEGNRQTAAWISHNLIQNNELGFFHNKSSILPFSNTEIVPFVFQLIYVQRIDMNDVFSDIYMYRKAMLNQVDRIRQG